MAGGSMRGPMSITVFQPDPQQAQVLDHRRGPLLVTGAPGTGKTAVLRERFARLIESGADPERVALVVRSKGGRGSARRALLARLSRPLPGMRVVTVHGLAHHALSLRFGALGYHRPPTVPHSAHVVEVERVVGVSEFSAERRPRRWVPRPVEHEIDEVDHRRQVHRSAAPWPVVAWWQRQILLGGIPANWWGLLAHAHFLVRAGSR